MAAVHEKEPHELVLGPPRVVKAVVQNAKSAGVDGALFVKQDLLLDLPHALFLAPQNVLDDGRVVFVVNEYFWDVLLVEPVPRFCT